MELLAEGAFPLLLNLPRNSVAPDPRGPLEGSFQLRAFDKLNVDLGYGAYTRNLSRAKAASEARLFLLYYHDGPGIDKVDNRPEKALEADRRAIRLATPGAHFIGALPVRPGTAEMVFWGAAQFGRWGTQQHLAAEAAAEAGYRFSTKMQPWIRAGYFRSTGDADPNDTQHNSFFQVLSSPRAYARFPFYILMNAEDRFGEFKIAPASGLSFRSELHPVRLSNEHDLWYDGGGAFQEG